MKHKLLTSLLLILSCFCTRAWAQAQEYVASVTIGSDTYYYKNFQDAWNKANATYETSTITLLKDVEFDGCCTLSKWNCKITIEGGNYTLTSTSSINPLFYLNINNTSNLIIKSGKFVSKNDDTIKVGDGNLTIQGGEFTTHGRDKHDLYFSNHNQVTITGGTFNYYKDANGYHGGIQCPQEWYIGNGLPQGYAFYCGQNQIKRIRKELTEDQLHDQIVVKLCDGHMLGASDNTCIYCNTLVTPSGWRLCYSVVNGDQNYLQMVQQNKYRVAQVKLTKAQVVNFYLSDNNSNKYCPADGSDLVVEGNQDGYNYIVGNGDNQTFTFTPKTTGVYTFVVRVDDLTAGDKFKKVYVFPEEATYVYQGNRRNEIYISALYEGQKIKVEFDNYQHEKRTSESCFNMYAHADNTFFTLVFEGDNLLDGDNHGGIKIPKTPHQDNNVDLYAPTIMMTSEGTTKVDFGSGDNDHWAIQDELGANSGKYAKFEMDPDCMYMYFAGTNKQNNELKEFVPEDVTAMATALKAQYVKAEMLLAKPYERTVNVENHGTICMPYYSTKDDWSNIDHVYEVSEITSESVVLNEVTEMQMGKPYIYKASASPISIKRHDTNFEEEPLTSELTGGVLHGTFYNAFAPMNSYVMQNNTFKKVAENGTIKQHYRAYLTLTDPTPNQLSIMVGGDESSAIEVLYQMIEGRAQIYDLSGHSLNSLQKGINIVNGKKIIVR